MTKLDDDIYRSEKHGGYLLKEGARVLENAGENPDTTVRIEQETIHKIVDHENARRARAAASAMLRDTEKFERVGQVLWRGIVRGMAVAVGR